MPVEIRSSGRSAVWYQVCEFPLGSVQLRERMQRIALADWLRHDGRRSVAVTAADRGSGASASLTLDAFKFAAM